MPIWKDLPHGYARLQSRGVAVTLMLGPLLNSASIDPAEALMIRHAFVPVHEDGTPGIHAGSSDEEILKYTRRMGADLKRFPVEPPPIWVVFLRDGGNGARLWSVVDNRGETSNGGEYRFFDLSRSERMADLRDRLVIDWASPRRWWIYGRTAARYPVMSQ